MRSVVSVLVCVVGLLVSVTAQHVNFELDGDSDGSPGFGEDGDTLRCETLTEVSLQLFMRDHSESVTSFLKLGCGLFGEDELFMASHGVTSVCIDPSAEVIDVASSDLPPDAGGFPLPVFVHTQDMLDVRDVLTHTAVSLLQADQEPVLEGFDVVMDSRLFAQVLQLEDTSAIEAYASRVANYLSPTGTLLVIVNPCSISGKDVADYLLAEGDLLGPLFEAAGLDVMVSQVHSPQGQVPIDVRQKLTELTDGEWRYTMQLTILARRPPSTATLPDLASLPPLVDPYTVSDSSRSFMDSNGFTVLPGLLSTEEVEQWGDVIRAVRDGGLWDGLRSQAPEAFSSEVDKPFIRVHNLFWGSPHVAQFVASTRLASAAAQLLGTDAVRVYQDSAFFKDPGDVDSPWHQDDVACPLDTSPGHPDIVTFWIPLVDTTRGMGSLEFADGSHAWNASTVEDDAAPLLTLRYVSSATERSRWLAKRGPADEAGAESLMGGGGDGSPAPEMEDKDGAYVRRHFPVTPGFDLPAGHATAHFGWTLHHAPPNSGNRTRQAFTISFFADGAAVQSDVLKRIPHPRRDAGVCGADHAIETRAWPTNLLPVNPPMPGTKEGGGDPTELLETGNTKAVEDWPEAVAWFETEDQCEMVLLRGVTMDDRATWEPLVSDGVFRPGERVSGNDPRLPLIDFRS